jgi:hypothetical protein
MTVTTPDRPQAGREAEGEPCASGRDPIRPALLPLAALRAEQGGADAARPLWCRPGGRVVWGDRPARPVGRPQSPVRLRPLR